MQTSQKANRSEQTEASDVSRQQLHLLFVRKFRKKEKLLKTTGCMVVSVTTVHIGEDAFSE